VRVLTHIKRLDDCFGDFLVRVVCECSACREIQPQAIAHLVGWKVTLRGSRYECAARGVERKLPRWWRSPFRVLVEAVAKLNRRKMRDQFLKREGSFAT